MNRFIFFLILFNFFTGCSFNSNSEFWTASKDIDLENANYKKILLKKEITLNKDFNANLKINLNSKFNKNLFDYLQSNNYGRIDYDGELKKISRYRFSKIDNFHKYVLTALRISSHFVVNDYIIAFSQCKGFQIRNRES